MPWALAHRPFGCFATPLSRAWLPAMARRALITGIAGQDGSYLAELLLSKGYEVHGVVRPSAEEAFKRISHLRDHVRLHRRDLLDQNSLSSLLRETLPDEIYNLAAHSFVPTSWSEPVLASEFTALGVTKMLEAIRQVCPEVRFYQASSSEMFGRAREVPQSEDTPFNPRSPYGVAKLYGHFITVNYRASFELFAVSGILFNHESPRRGLEFVTRKITHGVARICLGLARELPLGNLDAERDWGFAGDYVEAMWRMLQQNEPEDYVIASGESHSVREFCEIAFERVGKKWQDHVVLDPKFSRPAETRKLVGMPQKAHVRLGWKPSVGFRQLVEMMVDADVARLRDSISSKSTVQIPRAPLEA
jgi:GDPmannose 4,6-dehydratase